MRTVTHRQPLGAVVVDLDLQRLGQHLGASPEATFIDAFGPGPQCHLPAVSFGDSPEENMMRMAVLVRQYADLKLGGTYAGFRAPSAWATRRSCPPDAEFFSAACAEYVVPLVGVLPYGSGVVAADRVGTGPGSGIGTTVRAELDRVISALDGMVITRA